MVINLPIILNIYLRYHDLNVSKEVDLEEKKLSQKYYHAFMMGTYLYNGHYILCSYTAYFIGIPIPSVLILIDNNK